ncbi:hypothetical protein LINPERPRIM_LOCUS23311 [Linum perenne]
MSSILGLRLLFATWVAVSFSWSVSAQLRNDEPADSFSKFSFGSWKSGESTDADATSAQAPGPSTDGSKSTLLLAAERTDRPDILNGFKHYRGGWDFTNRHYWAVSCLSWLQSVGFTGASGFILAVLWFFSFGLAVLVNYFCGWKVKFEDRGLPAQRICLILLIVFTCAAAIGCILLSVGQGEFHGEAMDTLKYVVNQSDYTVQILRNVTEYLSLAKTIKVAQVLLPSKVMDNIDKLNVDLNSAANTLEEKTHVNSRKITTVFIAVRSALIAVATVMLVLAIVGFVLSILGHQHAIYIFVTSGWLLVAITFILCGVFLIFHKDQFNYYNQSGPPMPPMCYLFDSQLRNRQCAVQEVSMANASLVWQSYVCQVSSSGFCTTAGRITPDVYRQLLAAVNETYALEYYTPLLLSLQDCKFVRDTFREITSTYCPPLEHYLQLINAGLGLISVGVLLCLVLWILYANRPQREEAFAKLCLPVKGSSCNSISRKTGPLKNKCRDSISNVSVK